MYNRERKQCADFHFKVFKLSFSDLRLRHFQFNMCPNGKLFLMKKKKKNLQKHVIISTLKTRNFVFLNTSSRNILLLFFSVFFKQKSFEKNKSLVRKIKHAW